MSMYQTKNGTWKQLIPLLGKGLQRMKGDDTEALDPLNSIDVFDSEIWPHISSYFNNDSRVLDVGCGNGRFASYMSNHCSEVVAIDAFRRMNETHVRDNITFYETSLQDFDQEEFDVIFMFGVFYLQESWGTRNAFSTVVEKLKPGGVFITIDDKKRDQRSARSEMLPHGLYNLQELCEFAGTKIENEFIQKNDVHRITVIRK